MDEMFSEPLQTLKSRQGNVLTLEALTLSCIGRSTEFFLGKEDPFSGLPVPLFKLVADNLQQQHLSLYDPRFQLLISDKLRSLKVNFLSLQGLPENCPVVQRVHKVCKETLTDLHLEMSQQGRTAGAYHRRGRVQDERRLCHLLAPFTNLTQLSIDASCGISDKTLALIGSNCPHLRILNLEGNNNITDQGIGFLCPPRGKCSRLEVLDVTHCSGVTRKGLLCALQRLPQLTNLGNCPELLPALLKLVRINKVSKTLNLKQLSIFSATNDIQYRRFRKVVDIIPNVSTVLLWHSGKSSTISPLYNLSEICEINLHHTKIPVEAFNVSVQKFSTYLTTIIINSVTLNLDFSVFGLCTNLSKLDVSCSAGIENRFTLLPRSFVKLQHLQIELRHQSEILGNGQSGQLLSSPELLTCILEGVLLPQPIIETLIEQAHDTQQVFSSLETLQIWDNHHSRQTLMKFICVCPNLRSLVCTLPRAEIEQLEEFLKRNQIPVRLIC